MARLTVNLPQSVWDRLNEEAKKSGKPLGTFARELIEARDKRKNQG